MADRVGQILGNYQLLRLLGRGAFAEVYLAEHRYLEVPAAIKLLHVRMEPDTHAPFLHEARTIAHLQHPHIVRVLDFGFQDQTPYLVMEYTPGGTLRTRHPKGTRLPLEQIIAYVKQIASALDYAHQQHVIHRDIKPENLLLSVNDEVLLSDYGLAVVQQSLDSLSTQNQAGTPVYMAPEQIQRKPCAASDQYAVGVLVYEWLCGEPPFRGSLFEVLSQHLHQAPPSLCTRLPSLPAAVEDAVFGALAKEPQARFVSVQDFAEVLESVCDATGPLSVSWPVEEVSRDQLSLTSPLPVPMLAPSPEEEDRSSATTQPLALAGQQTADKGALIALEEPPPTSQTNPSSHREGVPVSRTNRQRFLRKVRAFWIAGVFEHSLHGAALVALGLQEQPDAVANPWQLVLQHPASAPRPLPAGTRITEIYDTAEGELLILGAPGSGKTTLLLELARDLLARAEQDEQHPLPVIFNLSSWAMKQQPLADWLVEELNSKYQVPRKLGRAWVDGDQILPLLDGLDEVSPKDRTRCIETINTYREEHGLLPLVICSRSADYLAQTVRVQLSNAVMVQSLTAQQIDMYLQNAGTKVEALRAALHRDPDLQELATTPLMLTILTLTYQGTPLDEIVPRGTLLVKQEQVFATYVQRMLTYRGIPIRYPPQQTIHWLSWLARQLAQHSQTVFYIERMQPDWLTDLWSKRAYELVAIRLPAILIGILVSVLVSLLVFTHGIFQMSVLLPYGLIGGLIGETLSRNKAVPPPLKQVPETQSDKQWHFVVSGSLRNGLLLGLGIWLILGLQYSVVQQYTYDVGPIWGQIFRAIFGVAFGASGFLLCMILKQRQHPQLETETTAGSWRSRWHRFLQKGYLRNGLLIGGFFAITATLSFGAVETVGEALSPDGLNLGLVLGPSDAVGFGLPFGLGAGLIGFFLSVILSRWDGMIRPAEIILWSWRGLWHHLSSVKHLRNGLLLGGLFALIVGTIQGFSSGVSAALTTAVANNGLAGVFNLELLGALLGDIWTYGIVTVALPLGLSISLSYWFLLGLFQSVSSDVLDDKDRHIPNQGIRDSASNCVRVGMVIGLASSFIFLVSTLSSYPVLLIALFMGNAWPLPYQKYFHALPSQVLLQDLRYLLPYLLYVGLVCGLIVGLLMGGLACVRHYILRFQLWRSKAIPWNYPRFLDYAAERILLRKVGGGYIFIHRLLLEYFASLDSTPTLDEARAQKQPVLPVS